MSVKYALKRQSQHTKSSPKEKKEHFQTAFQEGFFKKKTQKHTKSVKYVLERDS